MQPVSLPEVSHIYPLLLHGALCRAVTAATTSMSPTPTRECLLTTDAKPRIHALYLT
jgi:hypothetical protein